MARLLIGSTKFPPSRHPTGNLWRPSRTLVALSVVLGACLVSPLTAIGGSPTLQRNKTYLSAPSCANSLCTTSYASIFVRNHVMRPRIGIGTRCSGFFHTDYLVRVGRSGKFSATHITPASGIDPANPTAPPRLALTETIRGRVVSPKKVKGTGSQSDPLCNVSFRWVAHRYRP